MWPPRTGRNVVVIVTASALGFIVPIVVPAILESLGGDDGASSPVAGAVGGMLVTAFWQLVAIVVIGAVAGWSIGGARGGRRRLGLLGLIMSTAVAITLGGVAYAAGPQPQELGYVDLDSLDVIPIAVAAFASVSVGAVVGYAVAPRRSSVAER